MFCVVVVGVKMGSNCTNIYQNSIPNHKCIYSFRCSSKNALRRGFRNKYEKYDEQVRLTNMLEPCNGYKQLCVFDFRKYAENEPNRAPKSIADADRHLLTPWTLATRSTTVESDMRVKSSDASTQNVRKDIANTSTYE